MTSRTLVKSNVRRFFRVAISALLSIPLVMPLPAVAPARANAIGDVLGIVTDPLKLGKGSENILEAVERLGPLLDQLSQIEGKTNIDLTNRLNQLKLIVDEVVSAVDRNVANLAAIVSDAETKVAALEQQIYADAASLIYKAQCAVEVAATDQIQRGIAAAISNLIAARPGIVILGIRIISLSAHKIQIVDPDKAYISVRDEYLNYLRSIKENTAGYQIFSTYANIIRFARFAGCHYQNQPLASFFLEEEMEYKMLSTPWATIVRPVMQ